MNKMGSSRFVISTLVLAGCFPRPEPQQPQYVYPPPQYAQPQYAPQQYPPPQQPQQQAPQAQPDTTTAQGGVTVTDPNAPQPTPAQAPQGAPQPVPASYQGQPYYPYGQPLPPPQPYPAPTMGVTASSGHRLHDGEVIADFAVVGTFASLDVLTRQDIDNGNAVGFLLVAGTVGGGGIGYLLTNKYEVDAGAAHATTLGLTLGFANGALLIEPTGWTETSSVMNLLFLGSAAGATGGFIYGQSAKLTSGQSMFVANMALLGSATAALGAISGSRDGEFGHWENGTLAVGLDGGTVAGALIAPKLDWSARRAKVVFAATTIGALAGGMFAGLLTNNQGESRTENGDIVAGAMTAGLWGGFGLGVMMTKQSSPDPRFMQPQTAQPTAARPASPTAIVPWVGASGRLGVMTGGSF